MSADDIDAEIQRLAREVWTPDKERLNIASGAWAVVEYEMRERHTNLETVRRRVPDIWSSTAADAYQRRMNDISLTLDNVAKAASSWRVAMNEMYSALQRAQSSMNAVVREYWAKKKQLDSLDENLFVRLFLRPDDRGFTERLKAGELPMPSRSWVLQPYLDQARKIMSDLRAALGTASAKTKEVGPFQGAGPVVIDMSFISGLLAASVPAPHAPAPPAPPAGGAVPPVPTPAGRYLTVVATTSFDPPAAAAVPAPPETAGTPVAVPPPSAAGTPVAVPPPSAAGAPVAVPAPVATGARIAVPPPGPGLSGAPIGVPTPGSAGAPGTDRGAARSSMLGRTAAGVPPAPLPPGPTMPLGLRPPVSAQRRADQPSLGIPANPGAGSPRLGAQRPIAPEGVPLSQSASRQRDDRGRRGAPGTPAAALPTVPSLAGRKVVRIGGTDRTGAPSAPPPVARRRAGRPEEAPPVPVDETPLPAAALVGRRAQRLMRRAGGRGAGTIRVVPTRLAPGWAATRVARQEAVRPVLTGRSEGTDGFSTSAVVADRYMRLVEATRARRRTRNLPADRATATTGQQDAFQRRAAAPIALDAPAEVTVETTPALRPASAP